MCTSTILVHPSKIAQSRRENYYYSSVRISARQISARSALPHAVMQ